MLLYYVLIVCTFFISLLVSSLLIRVGIPKLQKVDPPVAKARPTWFKDLGFWIGFFEHLIIFVLVMNKEFSALAIIFGAKEFVRKDEIKANPAYYLLGTLINFGIALLFAEVLLEVMRYA